MRLTLAIALATSLGVAMPVSGIAQQQPNAAPAEGPTRAFTGADLFGLSIAADPQISPDGRTIVYVRRSADVMTDRMQSSLWLIDVASGRQTPFAARGSLATVRPLAVLRDERTRDEFPRRSAGARLVAGWTTACLCRDGRG
jgi:hypothetical protein